MELSLKPLCGCGLLKIVSKQLHVYNTLTDETIKTPEHLFISPYKLVKLQKILRAQHSVTPIIIHSHAYAKIEDGSATNVSNEYA